jgi:PDZ domain
MSTMAANPFDQFNGSFAAPAPAPMYGSPPQQQPTPGVYGDYQQNPIAAQQPADYNQNPYGGMMMMPPGGEHQPPMMAPPPPAPVGFPPAPMGGNPYESNPFGGGGGGYDAGAGVPVAPGSPGGGGGGFVAAPAAVADVSMDNPFATMAAAAGPPMQPDLGQQPPPQFAAAAAAEGGPYGAPPPPGVVPGAGAAYADPWGGPGAGAPPPPQQQQQQMQMPYGAPPQEMQQQMQMMPGAVGQQPMMDPSMAGALVPAEQQSNPYAQNPYGAPPQPPQNPYGPPPGQQMTPYGYPPGAAAPYGQPAAYAAPPPPAPIDPFSVFESQKSAAPPAPEPFSTVMVPAQSQQLQEMPPQPGAPQDEDFWGSFSAATPAAAEQAATPEQEPKPSSPTRTKRGEGGTDEEKKTAENLPPGGEWYDARIFTPTLGVMFFKPQELTDSLFLNTDKSIIDGLGERPIVAFIVEGSSARSAGVELGHVLLKVNGVDVKNPKEASRLIKEGPRPLPLLFYVPNTDVVVAEGEHMVKYDTRETTAPNSAKDWKPKYVVIGGIIAQPWMMNMYRSKVRERGKDER